MMTMPDIAPAIPPALPVHKSCKASLLD